MILQIKFSYLKFFFGYVSPFLVTIQSYLSSKLVYYILQKVAIAKNFSKKMYNE